jgi:argininosuccinate lyase
VADRAPRTLWHGRMASGPDESLLAFTESFSFDIRLWRDDIDGSRAHVEGLGQAGILAGADVGAILAALDRVADEFASGSFVPVPTDEDVHTAIERRVTELAGSAGARMHTGRSRNDQCVTALRLWVRRELREVAESVIGLCETLGRLADEAGTDDDGAVVPGYTHVQRAQPVLLAHHFLAHGWALARDADRMAEALARADVSPLGAGALAGSTLPLDPVANAERLGFAAAFDNSLDAVSDRDFVAEALFCLALAGTHLSRIGEEFVLWTSSEFGFAVLDDRYATGSSMLPQKKNADIAELARGKVGRLIGNLVSVLTVLKGLPLAYNRDLQEDKEPLFDSVDTVKRAVRAIDGMVSTATFSRDAMARAAVGGAIAAVDVAEWLVARGTPFRDAHAVVGRLVRESAGDGERLAALVAAELGEDAASLLDGRQGLLRRTSHGASGPSAVRAQRVRYAERLASLRRRFGDR